MPVLWRTYLALVLLVGGLVGACQTEAPDYPAAPDRIAPLEWREHTDLLQAPIELDTVGVRFHVPVGWSMLDSAAARRAHRAVSAAADTVDSRLIAGYGAQPTSSFLIVSVLNGKRFTESHGEDALRKALAMIRQVQATRIPVLRVDTLQRPNRPALIDVVIASQRTVHHKVLLEREGGSGLVQFDYVVPRIQYARVVPYIEAAVSSIQRRP